MVLEVEIVMVLQHHLVEEVMQVEQTMVVINTVVELVVDLPVYF